eukprot:TRINITY_DN2966_c3_g1_i2.p1 TRINITY_DN2966_c3_g1~~TRINITY_DN2966_c3_g1_i2.p1  ORF type:complete len:221 (+),score=38.51 TRINITY_DN2966_c3_g1_i2:41-703(+)
MFARALGTMAAAKPLVKVDIVSDTVCPWCFVGKKNLENAISTAKDKYEFEVRWHPYMLNPGAPKEGVNKKDYYESRFGGPAKVAPMMARMSQIFEAHGYKYSIGGLTGNTLDSHRLIELAGRQGLDKQNRLVDRLMVAYFTEEKFINDRAVLLQAAEDSGVTGAKQWLDDPNSGLAEVQEALRTWGRGISGVPNFSINGTSLSGAQPPETFLRVFEQVAS